MADRARLELGDCLDVLRTLPDASVDAMVTDPPAAISFMGKAFDTFESRQHFVGWLTGIMRECLRVLKPGAHALVWALDRTQHWTMLALEDAGFQLRHTVVHIHGQGFPKSHNPWLDVKEEVDAQLRAQGVTGPIRWR